MSGCGETANWGSPTGVLSSYLILCADNAEADQETGMEY